MHGYSQTPQVPSRLRLYYGFQTRRMRLVHLLVQCVEYDGQAGEIAITYHPGGLAAVRKMEVTAHA